MGVYDNPLEYWVIWLVNFLAFSRGKLNNSPSILNCISIPRGNFFGTKCSTAEMKIEKSVDAMTHPYLTPVFTSKLSVSPLSIKADVDMLSCRTRASLVSTVCLIIFLENGENQSISKITGNRVKRTSSFPVRAGPTALCTSAGIPSGPAALPFFTAPISEAVSSRVGGSSRWLFTESWGKFVIASPFTGGAGSHSSVANASQVLAKGYISRTRRWTLNLTLWYWCFL